MKDLHHILYVVKLNEDNEEEMATNEMNTHMGCSTPREKLDESNFAS